MKLLLKFVFQDLFLSIILLTNFQFIDVAFCLSACTILIFGKHLHIAYAYVSQEKRKLCLGGPKLA